MEETIWFKLLEMVVYVTIGIVYAIIGYRLMEFRYRKQFKLTEEVDNHNKAVGIMIGGLFIGIAIIMSGVL